MQKLFMNCNEDGIVRCYENVWVKHEIFNGNKASKLPMGRSILKGKFPLKKALNLISSRALGIMGADGHCTLLEYCIKLIKG